MFYTDSSIIDTSTNAKNISMVEWHDINSANPIEFYQFPDEDILVACETDYLSIFVTSGKFDKKTKCFYDKNNNKLNVLSWSHMPIYEIKTPF